MKKLLEFIKKHIFIFILSFALLFFIFFHQPKHFVENYDKYYNNENRIYAITNSKKNKIKKYYGSDINYHWLSKNIDYQIDIIEHTTEYKTIKIFKTENSGQTWESQLTTDNGILSVNYDSTFLFVDENLSFIYEPNMNGVETKSGKLMVSVNGAKSYKDCVIEHPNIIKEKNLIVSGLPWYENNELVLYVYTIPSTTYYKYKTKDCLTWYYSQKAELPVLDLNE